MDKHTSKCQWKMRNIVLGDGELRLILPLVSHNHAELTTMAQEAISYAPDIIEWRADYYDAVTEDSALIQALTDLRAIIGDTALMVTPRHDLENGVRAINANDKMHIFETVIKSGNADMIDVELRYGDAYIQKIKALAKKSATRLVVSYHDLEKTPGENEILDILKREQACGADILKVSFVAQSYGDIVRLGQAIIHAKESCIDLPIISISASDTGTISRIGGDAFGSDATFVSCGKTHQIHIADLRSLRKALSLDKAVQ